MTEIGFLVKKKRDLDLKIKVKFSLWTILNVFGLVKRI